MRISDWSSDVCSSDLPKRMDEPGLGEFLDQQVEIEMAEAGGVHLQSALAIAPVQVIPKRVLRDLAALAMHAVLDGLTLHELVACAIGGEERVERSGAGAGQIGRAHV